MAKDDGDRAPMRGARSAAFLLAQVGAFAGERFGERLAELDLSRPHAGVLRAVAASPGLSQQALAATLSVVPSRLVLLVDELEARGLVERRDDAEDRRVYALYLTAKGMQTMGAIGRVARAHDEAICSSLDDAERAVLVELLARIADAQGLWPGVHPGFRRLQAEATATKTDGTPAGRGAAGTSRKGAGRGRGGAR